jgi:hypothetical protein
MAGLAVVLDTNVLLSGLAYPASVPGRLDRHPGDPGRAGGAGGRCGG